MPIAMIVCAALMVIAYAVDATFIDANTDRLGVSESNERKTALSTFFVGRSRSFQFTLLLINLASLIGYVVISTSIWSEICVHRQIAISIAAPVLAILFISICLRLIDSKEKSLAYSFASLASYILYIVYYPFTKFFILLSPDNKKRVSEASICRSYKIKCGNKETIQPIETEENEVTIFKNALDFSKLKLKNVIVPRTEIVAIEVDESVEKLRRLFIETNYSRIVVYKGDLDTVLGYAHCSDIFDRPKEISDILNPIVIVPEEMAASQLFHVLQRQKKNLALVVDEFGGTTGIITMEDIMEEIFGEIDDEYDDEDEYVMKHLDNGEYIFSGRLETDEVNDKLSLDLPTSPDYETIAGLILTYCNILPKKDDVVIVAKRFQFTIIKTSITKIDLVRLKILA